MMTSRKSWYITLNRNALCEDVHSSSGTALCHPFPRSPSKVGMNLSPKKLKLMSKLIRQSKDFLNIKAYNFTGFLPQYYWIYSPQSRASNTLRYTIGEKMAKSPVFKLSTSENKAICTPPTLSFPFEVKAFVFFTSSSNSAITLIERMGRESSFISPFEGAESPLW